MINIEKTRVHQHEFFFTQDHQYNSLLQVYSKFKNIDPGILKTI